MHIYDKTIFFKHTFCEFYQRNNFDFHSEYSFKSNSNSEYFFTKEGVYRKSNHWGRLANCRWKLIANGNYKNQRTQIGFAKWSDFYPINSSEKIFSIEVDYQKLTIKITVNQDQSSTISLTYTEAMKKYQKIVYLLKNDRWMNYFEQEKEEIMQLFIKEFLASRKSV